MQFQFVNANGLGSGYMAFTDVADSCYYLLVTDAGHDAVHVIDVVAGKHMGYVAAPGAIAGPRGVATKGCRVAISSGVSIGGGGGDHVVRLFEGSGAAWTPVRELVGGHGFCPRGLRFTATGTHLVVADILARCVSLFCVEDGSFVRHMATGLHGNPIDLEECEEGWLVACRGHAGPILVLEEGWNALTPDIQRIRKSSAVASVGAFSVVRCGNRQLQFFATPDTVAMAAMTAMRVAWMLAAVRGVLHGLPYHTMGFDGGLST